METIDVLLCFNICFFRHLFLSTKILLRKLRSFTFAIKLWTLAFSPAARAVFQSFKLIPSSFYFGISFRFILFQVNNINSFLDRVEHFRHMRLFKYWHTRSGNFKQFEYYFKFVKLIKFSNKSTTPLYWILTRTVKVGGTQRALVATCKYKPNMINISIERN